MRTSVIERLTEKPERLAIVTSPEALAEKVLQPELLKQQSIRITRGGHLTISGLLDSLLNLGFKQTDFVYEPGWFSVRGSIVDVFSWSSRLPFRVSFIGNEVESVRIFDNETQLSVQKLENILILPDTQTFSSGNTELLTASRIPFTEFPHKPVITWLSGTKYILDKIDEIAEKTSFNPSDVDDNDLVPDKKTALASSGDVFSPLQNGWIIEYGPDYITTKGTELNFITSPQPAFNKNFELLVKNLRQNTDSGYTNFILSDNEKQIERLKSIFDDLDKKIDFEPVLASLNEGFVEHSLKIALYTDHQIFDRYHRFWLDDQFTRSENFTVRELTSLNPGDYVVHIDHGIGQFGGLEKIRTGENEQEAVRLVYRDNDVLYVSIHSLHRIAKFKGKDGQTPKIYKLGTGAWQKLKSSAKKKVKRSEERRVGKECTG
jgi:transcription-repair coupling factor (superfamily II helicase)